MVLQADLIHGTEWNSLIILDAARRDYFEKYNTYIPGKLYKCTSHAPHTWTWIQRTFPDHYDWTYFSTNPHITSKTRAGLYNANNHFKEIIDVFMTEWDDKLGTVHPERLIEAVRQTPYKKAVIHFMQPHGPWIGEPRLGTEWSLKDYEKYRVMGDAIVEVSKPNPEFMRKAYRGNLELVLKAIGDNLDAFRGTTIISADHGEMLGERDRRSGRLLYLHKEGFPAWADRLLRDVFWFEVEK